MKEYKHAGGDLLEVTDEYKLITDDGSPFLEDTPYGVLIVDEAFKGVTFRCPVDGSEAFIPFVSYELNNKTNYNWDWDITDGKLSLKQSILRRSKGGAHYYLRDNKFYPCYMCSYSQYDQIGNKAWDGKSIDEA